MASYHFRAEGASRSGAPLLFLFHGTGGDENQFFDLAGELAPGANRVAPRGDVSEGGALRYFRRTGEGVYDMADLAQRTGAMTAFVREQAAAHGATEIWGLGYSNGANILASMQFAAPDLFARSVLMHPLIPFTPPETDFAGRQVLITAGRQDPIAPASSSQALADYFLAHGAKADLVWHPGGHELRREELLAAQQLLAL
ncbi:phospholipase/carboxylesterase [Devosia crocina]|uniref:Phospholipase/carboxylesterase n=1 Tax=Devosia crocina TaxID=429728 RepID=A0A1I7MWH1_9HYPH|nr:alpha/beta hydrolase [Devosia crocina]SFV26698.1 phospholipase/carboxylesterase [Devosia crocina]